MRGDVEEEILVLRRRVLGAGQAGVAQHHQNGTLGIGLLNEGFEIQKFKHDPKWPTEFGLEMQLIYALQ